MANEKSLEITGKTLTISEADFYQAIEPTFFVNIRTLKGGPAPETMRKSLREAEENSGNLEKWVREKVDTILQAEQQLDDFLQGWHTDEK